MLQSIGVPFEVLGQFDVQFTCGGHSGHGRCYVAEHIEQLLGIEWMNQLPPLQKAFNAICCKIEQKPEEEGRHLAKVLAGEFPDVFREELGKCKTKATPDCAWERIHIDFVDGRNDVSHRGG